MTTRVTRWPARRLARFWAAGLLLEAMLLGAMFTVLVRPEPPLVERLRGDTATQGAARTLVISGDSGAAAAEDQTALPMPAAGEDSIYTVVHWPLNKPLLEGGGRVLSFPMRLWWVPALYAGAVPLTLIGVTGVWLAARRRAAQRHLDSTSA